MLPSCILPGFGPSHHTHDLLQIGSRVVLQHERKAIYWLHYKKNLVQAQLIYVNHMYIFSNFPFVVSDVVDNFQNKFEFQFQSYTVIVTLIVIEFIIIEHEKQIYVIVRLSLWYYNILVHLNFLILPIRRHQNDYTVFGSVPPDT